MKFTIDFKKWRSGGSESSTYEQTGVGPTSLLNRLGYMCCLGQICMQQGVSELKNRTRPSRLAFYIGEKECEKINFLVYRDLRRDTFIDSDLAIQAMDINDKEPVTRIRIERLKNLFESHGHELEFINLPGEL
jgi:hypothetical protein